jgi:transketolase
MVFMMQNRLANATLIDLNFLAKKIRIHALKMTSSGGSSHIGSCLSIADILAVLYGGVLSFDPRNPKYEYRDRFILSKGHAGAAVYAVLAECGFFETDYLEQHYRDGSNLSGHVSHKGVPGVELSTGSLGHGLGVGAGIAKALQSKKNTARVYVLMSDGECDEGSVWEAALFSQHHKLTNLTVIIDYNKIQSLGPVESTLALEPFVDKWRAFNFEVIEVDGHNCTELKAALTKASNQCPVAIIAHTTKGKGVSFMEDQVLWHYRTARGDEFERALRELQVEL